MIYENPHDQFDGCESEEDGRYDPLQRSPLTMSSDRDIPVELLLESYQEIHAMECQVARSLPVLAGSVMNVSLRRLLTKMAFQTRDRCDWLATQLVHHGTRRGFKMHLAVAGILERGNKELAGARNPFIRDLLMVQHCIQIHKHAALGYGIVLRLAEKTGALADAVRLASLLSELEVAGKRLQTIESELPTASSCHCARAGRMIKRPVLPRRERTLTPKLTKITHETQ